MYCHFELTLEFHCIKWKCVILVFEKLEVQSLFTVWFFYSGRSLVTDYSFLVNHVVLLQSLSQTLLLIVAMDVGWNIHFTRFIFLSVLFSFCWNPAGQVCTLVLARFIRGLKKLIRRIGSIMVGHFSCLTNLNLVLAASLLP